MKAYIAGKIQGDPSYREKFSDAAMELKRQGYVVMSPAILPDGFDQADYMRICLAMIDSVDVVFFLPDWTCSEGARVERAYCQKIGKTVIDYEGKESRKQKLRKLLRRCVRRIKSHRN